MAKTAPAGKRELIGVVNQRNFPHLVDIVVPSGGFAKQASEIDAFHRKCGIPIRRGHTGRQKAGFGGQFYVRFCFPDATTADKFCGVFGGTRLRYTARQKASS